MSRYRAYGPTDDPASEQGDRSFIGVNAYDRPENLQPGQVQAATNIDFTSGDAETRGGFVCIPELGAPVFAISDSWSAVSLGDTKMRKAIAYGNGIFVTLTEDTGTGDLLTSTDAVTWTTRSTGLTADWTAIAYGNGTFVALSGTSNVCATSTNGINWVSRGTITTPAQAWTSVCYGNSQFVAVSSDGGTTRAATSPDGVIWTSQTTDTAFVFSNWKSVAYGNGVYVAVGTANTSTGFMSSTDGVVWTHRTPSTAPATGWAAVTYGGSKFVALASTFNPGGSTVYSTDGVTWAIAASSPNLDTTSVTYGNGFYVAVSNSGVAAIGVATSTDGSTWTVRTAANDTPWYSVGFGSNTFVAVGEATPLGTLMTLGSVAGAGTTYASCVYSDPNTPTDTWVALAGANSVGFYAFGRTSRTVDYPGGFTLAGQGTLVQANNQLFLFPGEGQTPIYWAGDWSQDFAAVPASTLGVGYESIPESNQATYAQNRLFVVNGKDRVASSDVLDFTNYDTIANDFNLNTGAADYVVCTYPFGDNSLVVFKHNSSILLENVQGALSGVTATEISRNLGIIGINAVTAVGPDLVYVSDRNISSIRLNLQNKLQNVTEPLSRNIGPLIDRINWAYAYKISLGYWDNRLFVAVPMDNSVVCNTILVYNFITQSWYGEWTFSDDISMNVLNFVVANYLGQLRLHVITEDGRIFVTDQSHNDISGSTVAEITTSLTTRAYSLGNSMQAPQRVILDVSTNRPSFSVTSYSDGANEYSEILTDQTLSRADSWLWNDSTYTMTNANDDYNRAFRKDYATGPDSIQPKSGFQPEMTQDYRIPIISRRRGRLSWVKVDNTQGYLRTNSLSVEMREGQRDSLTQVG